MPTYKLTNKAVEDLNAIWEYTFTRWSEKQADTYYETLVHAFDIISSNPRLGQCYYNISNDLYWFKAKYHIIFYQILSHTNIKIIRILHEKMDFTSRIADDIES